MLKVKHNNYSKMYIIDMILKIVFIDRFLRNQMKNIDEKTNRKRRQ